MTGKRISWVIYAALLLAAVFTLGYLLGTNRTVTPVQVTVAAPEEAEQTLHPKEQTLELGLIDLNTADQAALETLPGIGPELAARIIAYREANGRFLTKQQIMDVEGIGEGRYSRIEPYLTVGGTE